MAMTYLEELTIRVYVEMGMPINVLLRPPVWYQARSIVARLMACDLDTEDSLCEEMPMEVAAQLVLVAGILRKLRAKYRQEGQAAHG